MEEVVVIGSHGPILIAQDGVVGHVNKYGVVEQPRHLTVVQFVLDEDSLGLHQQRQSAEDVEVVRNADGHGRLGQIHHDQIERSEPLAGDKTQTLRRITEPPLHPRILKVRLGVKKLQTLANHLLIQFQPEDQFHVGIFERFVEEHGVSPADEDDALHILQVGRGEVHIRLVVVRAVRVADLEDIVEAHANVGLVGILGPGHFLIE
mmetsp:Transcript_19521/g.35396  ORF Transcript_19521/g.35396 Transcript_19521/m.35396 type:complete len:206 (+) Transcript_19521:2038-2655(+)